MRLFFALPLPKGAAAEASSVQARMRAAAGPDARLAWAPSDQLHLTLSFLGEQPDAGPAAEAGREAWGSAREFEVVVEGAGAFPGHGRARALWLGISTGKAELIALATLLREALRRRGLPIEERELRPHLTVARVRSAGHVAAPLALAAVPAGPIARFTAGRMVLFESVLGGGPALHLARAEYPLLS
ncbi:MAG TPA: RNA 2',3'-cyclic phosphodiesterase [Myxococcales bacterium]|nr:RNA 2',3'-cyclic phosphodiesterase [Myxococcales bacterium]